MEIIQDLPIPMMIFQWKKLEEENKKEIKIELESEKAITNKIYHSKFFKGN